MDNIFPPTFPEEKPNVPTNYDGGWLVGPVVQYIQQNMNQNTKVIIEAGSWMGKSTRVMLNQAPNAVLYCIDTWEGGPEHQSNPQWQPFLPTLYETFIVNNWDWRDRIYPCRMDTRKGFKYLYDNGVQPDFCYIDACHDYEFVKQDFIDCLDYFPNAQIFGDDWHHPPIKKAVQEVCEFRNIRFGAIANGCWYAIK